MTAKAEKYREHHTTKAVATGNAQAPVAVSDEL